MKNVYKTKYGGYFNKKMLRHIECGNKVEILSILKDDNPRRLTDNLGKTLLHYSAMYGNAWFAKHLIDLGADVNAVSYLKQTPLMLAVTNDQLKTVEVLLEAGADIYLPDLNGQCALNKAFTKNDLDHGSMVANGIGNQDKRKIRENILNEFQKHITEESLRKSKYTNKRAFHIHCPLYYFLQLKNVDIIRVLLKKGSPVDAKNPITGETALHISVAEMDLEIIKILLENNADVNLKTFGGYNTPLSYLQNFDDQNKSLAIFQMLMTAGATLFDHEYRKIYVGCLLRRGDKLILRSLINYQPDLDFWQFKDQRGVTPLHYMAENKNPNILAELQNLNFDVNIQTKASKYSMLHYAVSSRNASSIQFLLNRGADVNITNSIGFTPLSYLIKNSYDDTPPNVYVKCIEILLSSGADPQIVTEENYLWLQYVTFQEPISDELIKIMKPIIAHVCLVEASGQPIYYYTRTIMLSNPEFKEAFDARKIEIEELKKVQLRKSFTLFDFFIADAEMISLYARYRILLRSSLSKLESRILYPCYQRKLRVNILKFTELVHLRETFASALNKIITELCGISVYNIAEKIVDYLEDHEIHKLLKLM